MLVAAVLALGLVPMLAFATAAPDGGAAGAAGITAGAAQGAGAPDGGSGKLATAAPLAVASGGARLGTQEDGQLYAVFDSTGGSLAFKREADTYNNGAVIDTKTYYTGFEDKEYSINDRPPWLDHASDIKKVDFQTAVAPKSCAYWFAGCRELAEVLGAGKLDTSGAVSMEDMFSGCSKLATLDVSKWGTSKVTNMGGMFKDCASLSSVKLDEKFTIKKA